MDAREVFVWGEFFRRLRARILSQANSLPLKACQNLRVYIGEYKGEKPHISRYMADRASVFTTFHLVPLEEKSTLFTTQMTDY
jgi:hypothetical protein